jgi:hypothetical protein
LVRFAAAIAAVSTAATLAACTTPPDAAPVVAEPCQGSVEFCGLPLTEIGLLGAHQAAASGAAEGWASPWTNLTMTQMLDRQVRAFHLQLRSGIPYQDGVLTDPDAPPPPAPAPTLRPVLEQARQKLLAGDPTGPAAVYVCDGWCELGAVPLESVLRELSAWFVENPRELVVLDLEDYVPATDVADAFRVSRLESSVIPGSVDAEADVQELLEAGQVLVSHRYPAPGDPDWYRSDILRRSAPLPSGGGVGSCRAVGEQPMLALEHWVAGRPPELDDAVANNEQSVLAGRISACRREADQLPTLLMLSFAEVGDGARALDQIRDAG